MYWSAGEFPNFYGMAKKEKLKLLWKFHRTYSRITWCYILSFVISLIAILAVYVNLPTSIYSEIGAFILGLAVWQVEYLVIVNKLEYPLFQSFIKNA